MSYKKELDNFSFNLLKGKLAEEILKAILNNSGFKVYNYGCEYSLQGLQDTLKDYKNQNETLKKVRSTPDFFVYSDTANEGYLTEVKYSNSSKEIFNDFDKYSIYWPEAYIILINPSWPNVFYIAQAKDLKPKKEFYNSTLRKKVKLYDQSQFQKIQDFISSIGYKTIKDTLPILKSFIESSENR